VTFRAKKMYKTASHSFGTQSESTGAMSSDGCYGSGYYGDPSAALLGAADADANSYGDLLHLQPTSAVCYTPTDGSCKAGYYLQGEYGLREGSSPTSYHEPGQAGDGRHHPGRVGPVSSSPSAAAVAEATAVLRLATSGFATPKPAQPSAGAFPLRGPTVDGVASTARLGSSNPQPSVLTMAAAAGYATGQAFHSDTQNGFQSASAASASGFAGPAGTAGSTYSAFQKLQTQWTTPCRSAVDGYAALDICKLL